MLLFIDGPYVMKLTNDGIKLVRRANAKDYSDEAAGKDIDEIST